MLYIIRNSYFIADYIFQNVNSLPNTKEIVWKTIAVRPNLWAKIRKRWDYYTGKTPQIGCGYFDDEFIRELQQIGQEDTALLFSIQNLKNATLIQRIINPKTSRKVWLWDSLCTLKINSQKYRKQYIRKLKTFANNNIYTFDPNDAKQYELHLLNQVYRKPDERALETSTTSTEYDLFFVGHDKPGRMEVIGGIAEYLESIGKTTKICVVPMIKTPPVEQYKRYYNTNLDASATHKKGYQNSLEMLQKSKIVLDVVQSGQEGQTLRAVEAMFLSKKIITTNPLVRCEPFYHPSRVFIWGEDSVEGLTEWIECEFEPLEHSIMEVYELRNWINNLI